jgi:hypothetical protein
MDLFKQLFTGYVRHGLTVAAGYLLAHGLMQQADQQIFISAGLGLAGIAWSTVSKLIHDQELRRARTMGPQQNPGAPAI